jgi:hypothetical protein
VVGEIEENAVIFFNEEPVAGFAENGSLLGEIEESHEGTSGWDWGGLEDKLRFGESGLHDGLGGREFVALEKAAGHRVRHEEDPAFRALTLPGGVDAVLNKIDAEEVETFLEAGEAGLGGVEVEGAGEHPLGSALEGVGGSGWGLGEDEEVVGETDKVVVCLLEREVEFVEEEVGEEGRERGALSDTFAEAGDVFAVPNLGVNPEMKEMGEFGGEVLAGEELEEEGMLDFVEEGGDVGVDNELKAAVAELDDAGDGAVDGTAGTVGEAGVEELLLEAG